MTLKTHWLGSFAWNVIVSTTKVKMKLLEMGKDMKINHSVSSPLPPRPKYGETFFFKKPKKALHWGANCFGKFMGKFLWANTWGLMIRSCKVGGGSFANTFSSNLNTEFSSEKHLKINPNECIELWNELYLRLMVKRF